MQHKHTRTAQPSINGEDRHRASIVRGGACIGWHCPTFAFDCVLPQPGCQQQPTSKSSHSPSPAATPVASAAARACGLKGCAGGAGSARRTVPLAGIERDSTDLRAARTGAPVLPVDHRPRRLRASCRPDEQDDGHGELEGHHLAAMGKSAGMHSRKYHRSQITNHDVGEARPAVQASVNIRSMPWRMGGTSSCTRRCRSR